MLAKYDDVDDQTGDFKETKKKTFTIGSEGSVSAEEKLKQEVKERLALSLDGPTGKVCPFYPHPLFLSQNFPQPHNGLFD